MNGHSLYTTVISVHLTTGHGAYLVGHGPVEPHCSFITLLRHVEPVDCFAFCYLVVLEEVMQRGALVLWQVRHTVDVRGSWVVLVDGDDLQGARAT